MQHGVTRARSGGPAGTSCSCRKGQPGWRARLVGIAGGHVPSTRSCSRLRPGCAGARSPSAGAPHSCDLLIAVSSVDGLDSGWWAFDATRCDLVTVATGMLPLHCTKWGRWSRSARSPDPRARPPFWWSLRPHHEPLPDWRHSSLARRRGDARDVAPQRRSDWIGIVHPSGPAGSSG